MYVFSLFQVLLNIQFIFNPLFYQKAVCTKTEKYPCLAELRLTRKYEKEVVAVTTIQKWARRHLAVRQRQQRLKSLVVIQSFAKMAIQRTRYTKLRTAAVTVQRKLRARMERQSYLRLRQAATFIQV